MNYQALNTYSGSLYGSPEYSGIEYDREVPDNMVVSSPGGVSDIQHHYTKGMYGEGATSSDIYADQGFQYIHGERGGIYESGQESSYYMKNPATRTPPPDKVYTENQSSAHRDNFTSFKTEIIPPSDDTTRTPITLKKPKHHKILFTNPMLLFIATVITYLALDYWVNAGETLILNKLHEGKPLTWKWMIFYAVLFTAILYIIKESSPDSMISLESV